MIKGICESVLNRVYDFCDMTDEELRCKFFQKLQECIDLCNNTSDIVEWLKNEGVENEVNELLSQWEQDGTLSKLINIDLFNNLKTELTNEINKTNEQMVANTNYTKHILKSKNNTPSLINSTLNKITNNANSVINFNSVNGVIELEAGIYEVDTIIMRSNITIKGQGIGKTIIKPSFSNVDKYIFDVSETDTNNRLVNFELKDLSIMPSPHYQYAIEDERDRYLASGINLKYCSSCRLTNIAISGFKGTAINQIENYDCNMDNVQILGCGDSTHNSVTFLNGTTDGCNAIHMDGLRIEQCSGVKIECNNAKLQREIQFSICKIEGTPFIFSGSSNINIIGCHFTWNSTEPLLNFLNNATTESYGIKFNGCSFLSNNGKLYTNQGNIYPQFVSCNFKGFNETFNSSKVNVQCCEFYSCLAPVAILENNNTFSNNKLIATRGEDYIIKLTGIENYVICNENISPITSKGGFVTNSFNQIINNYMVFDGVENWLNSNNYQQVNGIRATHNPPTVVGSLKYDVTTKNLSVYDDGWNTVFKQCENVPLCDTDVPSDLKTILNQLITNLKNANIMK